MDRIGVLFLMHRVSDNLLLVRMSIFQQYIHRCLLGRERERLNDTSAL